MSEETNCGRRVDVRLIRHSTGVLALFRFISLLFWYLRMNGLMGKIPSQVYDNYFINLFSFYVVGSGCVLVQSGSLAKILNLFLY